MTKSRRIRHGFFAAVGALALILSAAPFQFGSVSSSLDLNVANAGPGNSGPGGTAPGGSGPDSAGPGGGGGGGSPDGSGNGNPGGSGPGNS